ncbi:MAG: hypothetical protein SGJ20_11680 [Planctomycetota bacterium]|nr:hypothetical protein [Planctomycetota bacterium]
MLRFRHILLVAVAAMSIGSAGTLMAQGGCYGGFGGYGYGYGAGLYTRYSIPYFALHPPVYYSLPVPRTYGYSPWAYPPGVMTPDVEIDLSQDVINPHIPGVDTTKPMSAPKKSNRSAEYRFRESRVDVAKDRPVPQVMINPYVEPAVANHSR